MNEVPDAWQRRCLRLYCLLMRDAKKCSHVASRFKPAQREISEKNVWQDDRARDECARWNGRTQWCKMQSQNMRIYHHIRIINLFFFFRSLVRIEMVTVFDVVDCWYVHCGCVKATAAAAVAINQQKNRRHSTNSTSRKFIWIRSVRSCKYIWIRLFFFLLLLCRFLIHAAIASIIRARRAFILLCIRGRWMVWMIRDEQRSVGKSKWNYFLRCFYPFASFSRSLSTRRFIFYLHILIEMIVWFSVELVRNKW